MLQRVRPKQVCQPCSNNSRRSLARRLCTTAPLRTPRPNPSCYGTVPKIIRRQLSHTHALRLSEYQKDGEIENDQSEELSNEELLALQNELVEELAQELEQISEENSNYERTLQAAEQDSELLANIIQYGTDPIQRVRNSGGQAADVVREARMRFGDSLPDGALTADELRLYTRLYGEPSKDSGEDLAEQDTDEVDADDDDGATKLYSAEGEQIEYQSSRASAANERMSGSDDMIADTSEGSRSISHEPFNERNARMLEVASTVRGTLVEEGEWDDVEDEDEEFSEDRLHPMTRLGKFTTTPKTVFLSQGHFVKPFERIMSKYSNKHLKEMCEKTFGGPGLPNSPLTPRSGSARQQVPVTLNSNQHFMGEMEANAFVTAVMPPTYASIRSVLVQTRKRLGSTWLNRLLAKEGGPRVLDAGSGGVGIIAWREIVQAHWDSIHSSDQKRPSPPPSKSVVLTGSDELRHRSAAMLENTTFIPRLPDYVHTRDAATLDDDRPAQQRKQFDVIIASHSLFSLKEEFMRKQHVQNLWSMLNPEGGVLILIEKGIPRGFEAVAGAREMLLERYIAIPDGQTTRYSAIPDDDFHKKEKAMIIAPCTTHERCPMYTAPGLSRGRKDICSFQQRYIRPPFLQRVLGAKDRNHDDVDFSYISVMKGDDLRDRHISTWQHIDDPISAPAHEQPSALSEEYESWLDNVQSGFESITPEDAAESTSQASSTVHPDGKSRPNLPTLHSLPRAIFPPMKRRGHVIMDMCTPAGSIERWTIPRSFGKQAYHDARKARWGDLWGLGAKTRIARQLRLGTPEKELITRGKDGEVIVGKGRGRKERLKIKAMEILEQREQEKLDELVEREDLIRAMRDDEFMSRIDEPNDEPVPSRSSTRTSRKSLDHKPSSMGGYNAEKPLVAPTSNLTDEQVREILTGWSGTLEDHYDDSNNKNSKRKRKDLSGGLIKSTKEARRLDKYKDRVPKRYG